MENKIVFHLGHPAHYHLFKNTIKHLKENRYEPLIVIKKKDILEDLVKEAGLKYYNILPERRGNSKFEMIWSIFKQSFKLLLFCFKNKPILLLGSTPNIAHVGWLLRIKCINLGEDDAAEIPLYANITYPFSDIILSPVSCDNSKWNYKTIAYNSYHELAYLHPNNFTPDRKIVNKYFAEGEPFFVVRFSGLNAYHDGGVKGINHEIALRLVNLLVLHGKVIITSERPLGKNLEKYRMNINPLDIHHLLSFAKLFIGDSQTMSAEAGVLGTPFIRINDFVGKLGYLNELENKFGLGFGLLPENIETVFTVLTELLTKVNLEDEWKEKQILMLEQRIDFNEYLNKFILKNITNAN